MSVEKLSFSSLFTGVSSSSSILLKRLLIPSGSSQAAGSDVMGAVTVGPLLGSPLRSVHLSVHP